MSIKYRFVFIHIPKTAGNSVQVVLRRYSRDRVIPKAQSGRFEVRGITPHKHATMRQYKNRLGRRFDKTKIFAVSRDPWDRIASLYFHTGRPFDNIVRATPPIERYVSLDGKRIDGRVHLLRFDNLQNDFDCMCDIIGVQRKTLPEINVGKGRGYRELYTAKTRNIVAVRHKKEIEWGGYEF